MDWTESVCATGLEQSPINLDKRKREIRADLTVDVSGWDIAATKKIALGEGHMSDSRNPTLMPNHQNAVKADVEAGAATMDLFRDGPCLDEDGVPVVLAQGEEAKLCTAASSWFPLQYHWHAPSEHTVDGHLFDAELHFVHTNAEGQYAVLGVFFREEACAYIIPAILNADGTVKTP